MNFKPELAEKVRAGDKTQTRRGMSENSRSPWWEGACAYKVGRDYAICPGRGKHAICRVVIVEVRREKLGDITEADARAEGFGSRQEFLDAFARINGMYEPEGGGLALADEVVPVWALTFRLA